LRKILLAVIFLFIVCASGFAEKEKEAWRIALDNDDPAYLNFIDDIHHRDHHDRTPLHTISEYGKYNIAKTLIEKGADIHAVDMALRTPLHFAASQGQVKVAELLIEKGAKVDARGGVSAVSGRKLKYTPLHEACRNGHLEMVKLLVEHGADVNVKNYEDYTPLHLAVEGGAEMVEFLIEEGADVNTKDSYVGYTPLHRAARRETRKIEVLLKHGADLKAKNKKGETPYEFAVRIYRPEIAEYLKQAEKEYKAKRKIEKKEQKAKRKEEQKQNKQWWEFWK